LLRTKEFRDGIERSVCGVEQDLSYLVAYFRAAGLPGERYAFYVRGEVIREQDDLRGLAGALNAFERDEHTLHLLELRFGITGRLERRVRGKQDHLGLCTEGAKNLARRLLPRGVECRERVIGRRAASAF
jgi:hypothetical protein